MSVLDDEEPEIDPERAREEEALALVQTQPINVPAILRAQAERFPD